MATVTFSSFAVSQNPTYLSAVCSWSIDYSGSDVNFEIRSSTTGDPSSPTTDGTLMGTFSSSSRSGTITFSSAGTYYVWINMIRGSTLLASKLIRDLTINPKPSFTSFSVSQVSGGLNASCSWDISNDVSGTTFEIRSSTTNPGSNTSSAGTVMKTFSHGARSGTVTFSSPGYYFVWINMLYNGYVRANKGITITIVNSKPAKWSWSASNGNASTVSTVAALAALTYTDSSGKHIGPVKNFSYLVWNDMVNKVKEILDYKGYTWTGTFASYSNTLMTSSNKILTAERFNSLRLNIGSRYSTGIQTVSSGDVVYAWYFTTLANCINGWIDIL